jgi:hypothetical protein
VLVLEIVVVATLFVVWIVTLFMVLLDAIPVAEKVLWLVAVTLLAPFAIPVYFVVRSRRRRRAVALPPALTRSR